jgi:hypothetical protein
MRIFKLLSASLPSLSSSRFRHSRRGSGYSYLTVFHLVMLNKVSVRCVFWKKMVAINDDSHSLWLSCCSPPLQSKLCFVPQNGNVLMRTCCAWCLICESKYAARFWQDIFRACPEADLGVWNGGGAWTSREPERRCGSRPAPIGVMVRCKLNHACIDEAKVFCFCSFTNLGS